MRPTLSLLVRPRRPARNTPPLLAPLKLYREILRAHRNLPPEHRELGDKYVRAEFKAHKNIDNPLHIVGFLTSWQDYLQMVSKSSDDDWRKYRMSSQDLAKMNDEQIIQLHDLMKETQEFYGVEDVDDEVDLSDDGVNGDGNKK